MVGASRARVAKVVSLLSEDDTILRSTDTSNSIRVEYLPCVATFDSYENTDGNQVCYLLKVEYHGVDGKQQRGSSLAPFFDDDDDTEHDNDVKSNIPTFPRVSAVAVGCGIDSEQHVAMIQTLVNSLAGQINENEHERPPIVVKCMAPNPEYATMKDETEAYKALIAEEKEEATRLRLLGPGKMAKFASSLAKSVLDDAMHSRETVDEAAPNTKAADHADVSSDNHDASTEPPQQEEPLFIDPNKVRFACRTCRTILFGQDQLEDPPHVPMLHSFGRKSSHHSDTCKSLFLKEELPWMGDIGSAVEGKFTCPKCSTKIGHIKWAGAQCSCGTWVTPAIQVPYSKVDTVNPYREVAIPAASTVVSPTVVEDKGGAATIFK